jgi:hypothetical protein
MEQRLCTTPPELQTALLAGGAGPYPTDSVAPLCLLQGKRKLARAQRQGREQRKPVAVGAIMSNHISYADILVGFTAALNGSCRSSNSRVCVDIRGLRCMLTHPAACTEHTTTCAVPPAV